MSSPETICDKIHLRQSNPALPPEERDSMVTLAQKIDDFAAEKISHDEIYGFVIPLLMQGKVRLDFENHSERLEMVDSSLRQTRTEAVRIFNHFFISRGYGSTSETAGQEASSAETQRIIIHRQN